MNTFAHGVHPAELKAATRDLPVQRLHFVSRYTLLLGQHIGAPAKPVVELAERVQRGQLVAAPGGYVSVALHSPVTGTVVGMGLRRHPNGKLVPGIEIEVDPYADQEFVCSRPPAPESLSLDEFISRVQTAGLVGLGGAAFPSHVKYRLPQGKSCRRLVVNGCECEPYLTCDHRLMVERPQDVVRGTEILRQKLGAPAATIGVEANKPEAVEALRMAVGEGSAIEVRCLAVKYPQGAEKMLIKAAFGDEVPGGGLPLDIGYVVNNVGTVAAMARYFASGEPLVERLVTVSGPGIPRPANLLVPLGTPLRALVEHCGGLLPQTRRVVMGGPMMGMAVADLDAPVLKGTSGLLAFVDERPAAEFPCLHCGRCLEACPNCLNPSLLARLSRVGRYEEAEQHYLMDCFECGACSFSCPSNISLVHWIRSAKLAVLERRARSK